MSVVSADLLHDPTKPWYIVFVHGQAQMSSQDRERCEHHAGIVRRNMARRDGLRASDMEAYITVETVPPAWSAANQCERTDAHDAHPLYRGSPFVCAGIPMSATRCGHCRHLLHVGPCAERAPWTYKSSRTGALLPCGCVTRG
jgi:hypothetical protein